MSKICDACKGTAGELRRIRKIDEKTLVDVRALGALIGRYQIEKHLGCGMGWSPETQQPFMDREDAERELSRRQGMEVSS